MSSNPCPRRGTSYLEIQVAMVLLSIATAGLYSMSIVQTKQTRRLADLLPAAATKAINPSADAWERKLGVYASVEEFVDPTTPIEPYIYFEQVADNQDGSTTVSYHRSPGDNYTWYSWYYYRAYRDNAHYHPSAGYPGSYFRFRITKIPPGEYEVLTAYPNLSSLGSGIEHKIYDGSTLRATVVVDQTTAPRDVTYDGQSWERLAVVSINSGTLVVRLNDGPDARNYVIADAILVRSARSMDLVSLLKTPTGGATAVLEAP